MSNRVSSFTETALFNRWALDLFSPSDYQKIRVEKAWNSVLEALINCPVNPYSNVKNSGLLFTASKFCLTTPFKVAYAAFVTLTISRLGALYNGALMVYFYLRYQVSSQPNQMETWEKTKNYGLAFFRDAFCAAWGALWTRLLVEFSIQVVYFFRLSSALGRSTLPLKDSLVVGSIFAAAAAFSFGALLIINTPFFAPKFFAQADERVGMYLSMQFRQKLGIVSESGSLLPFSETDRLKYHESNGFVHFHGETYEKFMILITNAEYELIDAIVKCNKHLPEEQKIKFAYPFNANDVVEKLKSYLSDLEKPQNNALMTGFPLEISRYIAQIKDIHNKITILKDLFDTARLISYEDSIFVDILRSIGKHSTKSLHISSPKSYIDETHYEEAFGIFKKPKKSRNPNFRKTEEPPKEEVPQPPGVKPPGIVWSNVTFAPLASEEIRPTQDLYEKFLYDIRFNVGAHKNKQTLKTERELLELPQNATYNDYSKQKRKYMFALHPDKTNKEHAEELFKYVGNIANVLDWEYGRK